jgi:hypothetical protein
MSASPLPNVTGHATEVPASHSPSADAGGRALGVLRRRDDIVAGTDATKAPTSSSTQAAP